jgi:hypothetical protein
MPATGGLRVTAFGDMVSFHGSETEADRLMVSLNGFLRELPMLRGLDTAALSMQAKELALNYLSHSNSGFPAVFCVMYLEKERILEYALGDIGIGIKASLSSIRQHSDLAVQPDYAAIRRALEGSSSRASGGGYGFQHLLEYTAAANASVFIASGSGYYAVVPGIRAHDGDAPYNLPGVQVGLAVPVD